MQPTDPQARKQVTAKLNHRGVRDEEFGRPLDPPEGPFHPPEAGAPPPAQAHFEAAPPVETAPRPPASSALVPVEPQELPSGFRVHLGGDAPPNDNQQDAAVLMYEFERRRADWWRIRRFGLLGLPSLALVAALVALVGAVLGPNWANITGLFSGLAVVLVILWLVFVVYCWLTLPRVISFGRVYRRLVSIPLERGGINWCDAAVLAPNFPALRDSFFTLYQDTDDMGTRAQPVTNAEDTERKKQTLNDLKAVLKPVLSGQTENLLTPFIPRERTAVLDRVELEPLEWHDVAELALRSLPLGTQHLNTPIELQRFSHDVESYTFMKASNRETSLVQVTEEPLPTPLHRQIAIRINENFGLVGGEIDRWRERTTKEKAFHTGLMARYKEAEEQLRLGYERTALKLEEEIQPPSEQLQADAVFYRAQIEAFYQSQREVIESRRDTALSKLDRERYELETKLEELTDEQALSQAEFKALNEQRLRLETSTDSRFTSLKGQLADLLRRSYSLPVVPYFRSDYPEEPSAATAEETLQQLAELRAETRLATSAVNNALNRFARLRFEPLDELAQLENQISSGTKWQATTYLGNLINFKQSGQLLALAGEVSEAAGVYLDSVADFERLNRRWGGVEASIRALGLSTYSNRLQEAQEYLLALSQVTGSLHGSLMSATHNPEMARPATFQNIYDQAAGLQRELEELGALAASITRTEDQLASLAEELAELRQSLALNNEETERVKTDSSIRLFDMSQKLKQMLDKLEEFKKNRLLRMRSHIDELNKEGKESAKQLRSGAIELGEVANVADSILQRHIRRADHLLEEARRLHRGLENTLAGIVRDFEESILPDRQVQVPSELFVPVWYFQFKERPVWRPRVLSFAGCYTSIELTPIPQFMPEEAVRKERASLWRFLSTARPATFYRLNEDSRLATLVGIHNLEYPAGRIELNLEWVEKLATQGWLSRWLVNTFKRAIT